MQEETSTKELIQASKLSQCLFESFTNSNVTKLQSSVFGSLISNFDQKSRGPLCTLCQNHGKMVRNKGPKWRCLWKDCSCGHCVVTKNYRKFKASQIAARRALVKQRERGIVEGKLRKRKADIDSDVKVFSEQMCSSTTKTLEEDFQRHKTKESFGSATESQLFPEHCLSPHGPVYNAPAASVGNLSSIFESHGCLPISLSKVDVGLPDMNSTQPAFRVRETFQTLNTMFHPPHEIRYPIQVPLNGFRRCFDSAAFRTFEGSGSASLVEYYRKFMEHFWIIKLNYQNIDKNNDNPVNPIWTSTFLPLLEA